VAHEGGIVLWRDADRVEADFLDRPGIDPGAKRRGDHLGAETYAERWPVSLEARCQAAQLARDPRVLILLIDAHRATHHDEQVGLGKVNRCEGRIGDIDPVDIVARSLDRLAKTGDPFVGNMPDDQCLLHGALSACSAPGIRAQRLSTWPAE
jgi:hypothetical protein